MACCVCDSWQTITMTCSIADSPLLLLLYHICSRSKYRLDSVVRTTLSGDDTSYNCVMEMEDSLGNRGVKLSKELMKIAGAMHCCRCCCCCCVKLSKERMKIAGADRRKMLLIAREGGCCLVMVLFGGGGAAVWR